MRAVKKVNISSTIHNSQGLSHSNHHLVNSMKNKIVIPLVFAVSASILAALGLFTASDKSDTVKLNENNTSQAQSTQLATSGRRQDKPADAVVVNSTEELMPAAVLELLKEREGSPFLEAEVTQLYEQFLTQFNRPESLTEEQIQRFFSRMNDTLIASSEARLAIAEMYRNFPVDDHTSRLLMGEMLMGSNDGRQILADEADFQLQNGVEMAHSEAFRVLANVGRDSVNYKALEKAIYHISSDTSEGTVINALAYVGEIVERNIDTISPMYHDVVVSALKETVLRRSDNLTIQTASAQRLYYTTTPDKSASLANEFLLNSLNSSLIVETIYAIQQGYINMNPELEATLRNTLNRSSVTPLELDLAQQILAAGTGNNL
ncbi:MAG: hypothetical protein ACI9WC_003857 [Arenicella sp.]